MENIKLEDQTVIFREFPEYNSNQPEKILNGNRFIDYRYLTEIDIEFMTATLGHAVFGKNFDITNQDQLNQIILYNLGYAGIINKEGEVLYDRNVSPVLSSPVPRPDENFSSFQKISSKRKRIEDFGEKIGGAKKDFYARSFTFPDSEEEILNIKTTDIPSSKDFTQLYQDGLATPKELAYLRYVYENLPRRSSRFYKTKWLSAIKEYISIYNFIVHRPALNEDLFHKFSLTITPPIERYIQTLIDLGFPTEKVKLNKLRIIYSYNREEYIIVQNKTIVAENLLTWQEAINKLKDILQIKDSKKSRLEFRIGQYKDSGQHVIYLKIGSKQHPIKLIDNYTSGRAYINEHYDELETIWKDKKQIPPIRTEKNRERTGIAYRKDNVSPKEFMDTFEFRGVEFGNWVKIDERQQLLNQTYNALLDLSTATGITPAAISLNGTLALALGARGSGKYSAHYETSKRVINLTKTRGAGSLAHEWWHALDNYFSRIRNDKLGYLSKAAYQKLNETIRPEVISSISQLVNSIKKTGLPDRSLKIDSTRSKEYWSDMCEITARSFEIFVIDSLKEKGIINDFLANITDHNTWKNNFPDKIDIYPYPTKEEAEIINANYKNFFNTLKEKKNLEKENVTALYKEMESDIFYSNAEYAVKMVPHEKASPTQWLKMLEKKGGIKAGEDQWLGLSDFLTFSKQRIITKQEILSYINSHKITIQERLLNKQENYRNKYLTTPGLSNKKEIIFWTDNTESWNPEDIEHFGKVTHGKTIAWGRFGEISINGERCLVIDEIQSKRHQARKIDKSIPAAPFEKNWHEVVMKRLLRYAADNDYSRICWTSGQQQIERYQLTPKRYDIIYSPEHPGRYPGKLILLSEVSENSKILNIKDYDNLKRVIGTDNAEKINKGISSLEKVNIQEGQGLINFYDKMLPQFLNKYCKKWEQATELIKIAGYNMYSIKITDQMRKSICHGQPLFYSAGEKGITEEKIIIPEATQNDTYLKENKIELKTQAEKIITKIRDLDNVFEENIKIIAHRTELPEYITKQMKETGRYPGVFDLQTNQVYLVVSELKTPVEIEMVLKHEILGHRGIRSLKKEKLHEFLGKVYESMPEADKRIYDTKYQDKHIAAEEYIADQAIYYQDQPAFQKIKAIFRECLRNWGFKIQFSDNDINFILSRGKKALQQQVKQGNLTTEPHNRKKEKKRRK